MNLGSRMKSYEQDSVGSSLIRRCPAILRIDGRAFHSFTQGFESPWDWRFHWCMFETAKALCSEISTAKFVYGQSDEVSILLTDYDTLQTDQWFGGGVQKIASVGSSIATLAFNKAINSMLKGLDTRFGSYDTDNEMMWSKRFQAMFDARVFSIPKDDVTNYFVWRQKDATRNSIQMLGRCYFSHKQLLNKSCDEIQEMLWQQHNINWNESPTVQKRGWSMYKDVCVGTDGFMPPDSCMVSHWNAISRPKWGIDLEMPIITQDRDFVEKWLTVTDDVTV